MDKSSFLFFVQPGCGETGMKCPTILKGRGPTILRHSAYGVGYIGWFLPWHVRWKTISSGEELGLGLGTEIGPFAHKILGHPEKSDLSAGPPSDEMDQGLLVRIWNI